MDDLMELIDLLFSLASELTEAQIAGDAMQVHRIERQIIETVKKLEIAQ